MVYTRILMRYLAGVLLAREIIPEWLADMIANDPEIAVGAGLLLAAVAEGAYALARRIPGWKT